MTKKCTCGVNAIGGGIHSDWCDTMGLNVTNESPIHPEKLKDPGKIIPSIYAITGNTLKNCGNGILTQPKPIEAKINPTNQFKVGDWVEFNMDAGKPIVMRMPTFQPTTCDGSSRSYDRETGKCHAHVHFISRTFLETGRIKPWIPKVGEKVWNASSGLVFNACEVTIEFVKKGKKHLEPYVGQDKDND